MVNQIKGERHMKLVVKQLSKQYGKKVALQHVNLELEPGILGF